MGLTALSLLLFYSIASAEPETSSLFGLPLADVALSAPSGGLPEESLAPLLHSQQGLPLDRDAIRTDINTLYRVGGFSQVEAIAEPWFTYNADGEVQSAVSLRYRVTPAPQLAAIHVQGAQRVSESDLLDAVAMSIGDVYYPDYHDKLIHSQIQGLLSQRGFPGAIVEVDSMVDSNKKVELWLRLFEGKPTTVDAVGFLGDLPVPKARLRRWARRAGVRPNHPLSPSAIREATDAIRAKLARGGRGPLWLVFETAIPVTLLKNHVEVGWVSARVGAVQRTTSSGDELLFTIESGPKLHLQVKGLGFGSAQTAIEALDLNERTRLTRGFMLSAPERIREALINDGYLRANADVQLLREPEAGRQELVLTVSQGPRIRLKHPRFVSPDSKAYGLYFSGNTVFSDDALRSAMRQASPAQLRRGIASDQAIEKGLSALKALYSSRGYPEAAFQLQTPTSDHLRWGRRWTRARQMLGRETAVQPEWIRIPIQVVEGPLHHLVRLEVSGTIDAIGEQQIDESALSWVNGPYSPPHIAALSDALTQGYRERGYLDVQVQTQAVQTDPTHIAVHLQVTPGEQLLLRSSVTQGVRRTQTKVVQRNIPLILGQPISPSTLQATRAQLLELGVFRSVQTDIIGDEAGRDLIIRVKESPRNQAEIGGGVSTDRGLRVLGQYTRLNAFGLAHRLELNTLIGIRGLQQSKIDFRSSAIYTAPQFPTQHSNLSLDLLFRERKTHPSYEFARSGLGLVLDLRLSVLQLQMGARAEARQLQKTSDGLILPGDPWSEMFNASRSWRPESEVYALWLIDLRDDPIRPTRGSLLSLRTSWLPSVSTQNRDQFFLFETRVGSTLRLSSSARLRVSSELDYAYGTGPSLLPLEDRYRLGGTGSLRGFQRDTIGPRVYVPGGDETTPSTQTWVPVGGDVKWMGSVELLLPLNSLGLSSWEGYTLALFSDLGNVWLTGLAPTVSSGLTPSVRSSLGLGLRVDTPIGPLQVDLASNLAAHLFTTEAQKTWLKNTLSEPPLRLHISLGDLF